MDKKKIVSFYSELPSLYMHSLLFRQPTWLHALSRDRKKNSNLLRLGIFWVTIELLFRLYINVHPKSDIMYIVFHLCYEK